MARIAIFCYSASLAHAGRAVTLGRALQADGHQVTLVGQPRYLESSLLCDRAEFELEVVFEPDLARALAPARGQAAGGEQFLFAGAVADEAQILPRLRPDLVIVDNRRSAIVSAEAMGVPTLSLTNASLLGPWCAIDPTVDELADVAAGALDITAEALLGELASQPGWTKVPIKPIPLPEHITSLFDPRVSTRRSHVHELCLGTRTAVLDVATLYPVRDLPAGVGGVGPLLFDVAVAKPAWWDELDDRPIVYVTFGSTGEAARFEYLVEELAGARDLQIVVATADLLPVVPEGVRAARYLPSSEMMARAALVVCHGGSLTMYQAIQQGTPVLAIPTHLEQAIETIPLVRAGLARSLAKAALHPGASAVTGLVEEMLGDSSYPERAAGRAAEIDSEGALQQCIAAANALL